MSTTRYHRAAKDGATQILKQATKKDLNTPDSDGMTPTLWCAYYGHLKALETCCKRQGNPNKTDYSGNSAVHLCAKNGKLSCLRFLVSFGANLWIMDNDLHTPRDVAVIRDQQICVEYLDSSMNEDKMKNPKNVKKKQKDAKKEAEIRKQTYNKMLERRQNELQKRRESLIPTAPTSGGIVGGTVTSNYMRKGSTTTSKQGTADVTDGRSTISAGARESNFILAPKEEMRELKKPNKENDSDDVITPYNEQPVFGTRAMRMNVHSMFGGLREEDETIRTNKNNSFNSSNNNPAVSNRPALRGIFDEEAEDVSPIEKFLTDIGLSEYVDLFIEEKVDMELLMDCADEDLKNMGLAFGVRKTILKGLKEKTKQQEKDEITLF